MKIYCKFRMVIGYIQGESGKLRGRETKYYIMLDQRHIFSVFIVVIPGYDIGPEW